MAKTITTITWVVVLQNHIFFLSHHHSIILKMGVPYIEILVKIKTSLSSQLTQDMSRKNIKLYISFNKFRD